MNPHRVFNIAVISKNSVSLTEGNRLQMSLDFWRSAEALRRGIETTLVDGIQP